MLSRWVGVSVGVNNAMPFEALLRNVHPCLQLVEQTVSAELACEWLTRAPAVEGVVGKRADGRYRPVIVAG